ncbi:type II toxin-antitoxin system RelE/ParE family toxin [Endozoicomonas sp. 8E]|uniref:type II toxin-antitoxin system RelE family toxin n=1 Tax=Endozoicomonas sp. 8E TaxID=3035692 RepID=UPI002938FC59|nr:type II toxin-antitoxin system RelE/ParE family toxin [Endozoicomonas sp. 8E]WOG27662.1 type II toxin-antitoxin system RelE/ParE family toxin [Endozoicomonas sp. 8E]
MTYKLIFKEEALKEWHQLDQSLRDQFRKKLDERRRSPKVQSARLRDMKNCYKIKLRSSGFRLVYEVRDKEIVIVVIAVGKRDRQKVYRAAQRRL